MTMSLRLNGCTTWTITKCMEKKQDGNYLRMLHVVLNKSGSNSPPNSSCTTTCHPSYKPSTKDDQKMMGITKAMFSCGLLHIDAPVLDDK